MLMHAGHHIVNQPSVSHNHIDGLAGHAEAVGMTAEPGVLWLQPVEADGDGAKARFSELGEAFGREVEPVGNHSPGETTLANALSTFHNVLPDKRFAASEDDEDIAWVPLLCDVVEYAEEILAGHVGRSGDLTAIAAAVPAMDVAAHGTLPDHLPERMFPPQVPVQLSRQLKRHLPPYA